MKQGGKNASRMKIHITTNEGSVIVFHACEVMFVM